MYFSFNFGWYSIKLADHVCGWEGVRVTWHTKQAKIQAGRVRLRTFFFWKHLWNFLFFLHFTPGNSRENKASPLEISKKCVTRLCNFKRQKQRPLEIPHFFLITPGNTSMLLINPWKCHLLFLQKTLEIHMLNPQFFSFFFLEEPNPLAWKKLFLHSLES